MARPVATHTHRDGPVNHKLHPGPADSITSESPASPETRPPAAARKCAQCLRGSSLSYLTHWVQRSSSQAQLSGRARSLGANGLQPAGSCCHLYRGSAVVTCLEIHWARASGLADRLPLVTASRGPGGRLRNVSTAGISQRSQARLTPSICFRRLHRLSGCLRTDPSVMAGGWAVSGTGRFSRGWLPAPSERSHRPGMSRDASPALGAGTLCRRGMYGRRRGRSAWRLPSPSGLGMRSRRRLHHGW